MIQSVNNAYIKELVRLKNKKARDEQQLFLIEGEHLVNEAEKCGFIKEIFCLPDYPTEQYHSQVTLVSPAVLAKLTFSKTPQPVVALCHYLDIPYDFKTMKRVFLLDGLQDPGNIGTIIRTALAMGFDAVVISPDSVDIYHDKLLRACQGANFYLPVIQMDLSQAQQALHQAGFSIYATALRHARPIDTYQDEPKMAFVLGNEGNGVREKTIELCDDALYIPIQKAESLNVAITAGMLAYRFGIVS